MVLIALVGIRSVRARLYLFALMEPVLATD